MTDPNLEAFASLARSRRTSLCIDPEGEVPLRLVDQLCAVATWAPNHKRTWPWRFAVFSGDGRRALGQAFAEALPAGVDPQRKANTQTKYLRAPVIVLVGAARGDPARYEEDRDATAAGMQTLLLAATAAGLASCWSSPPAADAPNVIEMAGTPARSRLVAAVYLGWATRGVITPKRPAPRIIHVTGQHLAPSHRRWPGA